MVKFKPIVFEKVSAHMAEDYAKELADSLHADDRAEMELLGVNLYGYIQDTIELSSECMAVRSEDGRLLNMMGICQNMTTSMGVPVWSLKSEKEKDYRKEFVFFGLKTIEHFLSVEPRLFNFISRQNKSSLRFIKRAGAKFYDPVPYGAKGEMFCPFTLERGDFKCVAHQQQY